MYKRYFKRPMDIILAGSALIIFSPIMLVIALLVRLKLGSPVFFKQQRPGLNEKIFVMYKFRTMTDERDQCGNLLPDEVRLTEFGKWLRSTSLDELPELLNIVKGDMSIVGPRPQLVKDLVFMTVQQRARHGVMPGLTGLAQISGRNDISWEKKFKYDLQYIEQINLLSDCNIIYQTILKVARKEGVSAVGMETAEDLGDYLLRIRKIDQRKYDAKMQESRQILLGIKVEN